MSASTLSPMRPTLPSVPKSPSAKNACLPRSVWNKQTDPDPASFPLTQPGTLSLKPPLHSFEPSFLLSCWPARPPRRRAQAFTTILLSCSWLPMQDQRWSSLKLHCQLCLPSQASQNFSDLQHLQKQRVCTVQRGLSSPSCVFQPTTGLVLSYNGS